eukprot:125832_1
MSFFDSISGYIAPYKQKVKWTQLAIMASAIGTMYAAVHIYRARKHDNIPSIAPNDFSFLNGHLSKLITDEFWIEWLYHETKKMNFPPVVSMSAPGFE